MPCREATCRNGQWFHEVGSARGESSPQHHDFRAEPELIRAGRDHARFTWTATENGRYRLELWSWDGRRAFRSGEIVGKKGLLISADWNGLDETGHAAPREAYFPVVVVGDGTNLKRWDARSVGVANQQVISDAEIRLVDAP